MTLEELHKKLIEIAAQSPAKKRKVGAAVVLVRTATSPTGLINQSYSIVADGWNYNLEGGPCEDENGNTHDNVQHAEVTALKEFESLKMDFQTEDNEEYWLYVTHQPCDGCFAALKAVPKVKGYIVVGEFMKFDAGKLRYDLIPPSATEALATILTYGAKKYKPNNWRNVKDPDRYIAAAMRHFEAYRAGEMNDAESGQPHLAHAMTNLSFLLELKHQPGEGNDY